MFQQDVHRAPKQLKALCTRCASFGSQGTAPSPTAQTSSPGVPWVPKNGWFCQGKSKWMIRGRPISGNFHMLLKPMFDTWGIPKSSVFNRIFHYKPSILECPIYGSPHKPCPIQ